VPPNPFGPAPRQSACVVLLEAARRIPIQPGRPSLTP
jgi:hypothetical protein